MFNCLSNTHTINKCTSRYSCQIDGCKKRHHTILHPPQTPLNPNMNQQHQEEKEQQVHCQNSINKHSRQKSTLLQIVPVQIINNNKVIEVNALLDIGSDTCLITQDIVKRLNLKGVNKKLNINSALSSRKNINSEIVKFNLK